MVKHRVRIATHKRVHTRACICTACAYALAISLKVMIAVSPALWTVLEPVEGRLFAATGLKPPRLAPLS